jgi:hypothetical protein
MSTRSENWALFYANLQGNEGVNQQMAQIMNFNRFQLSHEDCISNLANNPGLSILAVNGFNELFLFHTVNYFSQNLFCPEPKLLGLSGCGARADCFRLDPTSLFQDVEIQTPNWRDLKGAASPEAVDALQVADQNPAVFRGKLGLIIPPLVSVEILATDTTDPAALIPLLSNKFQEFDRSSPTVKACTVLRPVLEYLWAVHKRFIPPTTFSIDRSTEGRRWADRMHFASISQDLHQLPPPPFPLPPPPQAPLGNQTALDEMAGSLRVLRDATERQLLRETSLDDKKDHSNGWDKIPEVVQKMILKLSAVSDDALPVNPCESYLRLLKQPKALGVAMVLNIELSIRGCQVEVPTTMANAIKTGNFRANSLLVAHSFSIFNVPYIDAANMTSCNKTELDLLQSEGEGIPKEMVKKLAENKFKFPSSSHHLRHQFNNWYGVLQVCFGEQSLVAKESRAWITHIDQFESSYDACFKADSDFGAKILGLVDLTFFQLCDACLRANSIEDVDFTSIALNNKRFDILQNCFQANKPVYLTSVPKKTHPLEGEEGGDEAQREGKKKPRFAKEGGREKNREDYRDLGAMVRNGSQQIEWKVTGPKYRQIFTPAVIASTPPFNATGLVTCNKWHVQGFCYEKCDRKASHKNFDSASHKSVFDKWIKELKSKCP